MLYAFFFPCEQSQPQLSAADSTPPLPLSKTLVVARTNPAPPTLQKLTENPTQRSMFVPTVHNYPSLKTIEKYFAQYDLRSVVAGPTHCSA